MNARPLVLLTDFGSTDFYAGVMRSVLASASPASPIIDLHHDIPAHDISAASFVLARTFEYLPRDAVIVCVVDPGVGTERRCVAITIAERTLIGPDNGFASDLLLAVSGHVGPQFYEIDPGAARGETGMGVRGATFHGRDIFAPVAAAIANGTDATRFGQRLDGIVMLRDVPSASLDGEVIHGRARYVDGFGNVMTDIPEALVRRLSRDLTGIRVSVAGHDAGWLRSTYAEAKERELVALVNSWGLVEAAVNGGRAIDHLGNPAPASIGFELRARH
jgi:S-adenosylmethionine hydrolase